MTIPAAQLSRRIVYTSTGVADIYRSNRQECLGRPNIGGNLRKEDELCRVSCYDYACRCFRI